MMEGKDLKVNADNFYYTLLENVRAEIAVAPVANVVEVVRCEDCKYAKPYAMLDKFGEYECTLNQDYGEQCTPLVIEDDFCSYGKPKDRGKRE